MKSVANFILGFFLSSVSYAFECQNIPDFKPIETQSVKISVDRFYWSIEEGSVLSEQPPHKRA
jgi:hypothetical protein